LDQPPTLRGDRVVLRPIESSDVRALARIRSQPAVQRWWRGGDDFDQAVQDDLAEPGSTAYVIEVDGEVAGWIQWQAEDEPDYRHAEIDIYLDADLHGRGLGTDAVRTLARHLVRDHGHHRITIDPAADNVAAIRCYEKVGFRPIGVARRSERGLDDEWHDSLMMDLLADELDG
jgi:aminoglycoside 6'-N-acetyltransferase